MANTLIKDTTIEPVVGYEEVPAIPYRPPIPGRTVYETRRVCMFRYTGPGHYVFTTDPQTGEVKGIWVPDSVLGGSAGGQQGVWACSMETVPVTYPGTPAQPYVPGYTVAVTRQVTGFNLGWNAGARSIAEFKRDGYVEFKVRQSVVGVICGINFYDGVDARYNGNTIDFAFYCARGEARVIRNGVLGAGLGAYTDATVFRVERSNSSDAEPTIALSMDGIEVFSVSVGVPRAAGWLEASLYSGNDSVFDPKLVQVSPPDLTAGTAVLEAQLEPLSMFAAAGAYAELRAQLSTLRFAGESGLVTPSYAVGDFILPPMSLSGSALVGETATLAAELPRMEMLAADHPYGELRGVLEPLGGVLLAYEDNFQASMSSLTGVATALQALNLLVVTMQGGVVVAADLLPEVLLSAEMIEQLSVGSALALSAVVEAAMQAAARAGSALGTRGGPGGPGGPGDPGAGGDTQVWVVNLDSNASTSYSNYDYNSFARIGDRFYGASDFGLFELAGDDDAGAPIEASISLGKLGFGTKALKTISEAYVGMAGEAELYVKVIAEGREFIYKARGFGPELKQRRVEVGRGLSASYLTVELFNKDGADFEIDSVQFRVADLKRKI